MDEGMIIALGREFFQVAVTVSGPVMLVAVVTGVLVSVGQVLTSIQDATLAFVVRLAAVGLVMAMVGQWMLHAIARYTTELWQSIPRLLG